MSLVISPSLLPMPSFVHNADHLSHAHSSVFTVKLNFPVMLCIVLTVVSYLGLIQSRIFQQSCVYIVMLSYLLTQIGAEDAIILKLKKQHAYSVAVP